MIIYTLLSRSGSSLASAAIGGIVILTGVYFLLRNAFGLVLPPIDWDLVWPIVVIASGVAIVSRAAGLWRRKSAARPDTQRAPEQE